ncbi:putative polycomb protein, VEFS-Box [Helianthus debilis subsp. tardiflorus]
MLDACKDGIYVTTYLFSFFGNCSLELLQKRQFFHSHRAQPMAVEQVFAEQDSEDEVDGDVADLEDRRMLDDFLYVTSDEKKMMHLWNSFVRKQR